MEALLTEEWNDAQNEIWKNVKKYTKLILDGEWEKVLEFFHEEYSGWNNCGLIPASKIDIINEFHHLKKIHVTSYTLTPIAINMFKGVAVVHYFFSMDYKNEEGKTKSKTARNTDVLMKQKDRWILIGDHVG